MLGCSSHPSVRQCAVFKSLLSKIELETSNAGTLARSTALCDTESAPAAPVNGQAIGNLALFKPLRSIIKCLTSNPCRSITSGATKRLLETPKCGQQTSRIGKPEIISPKEMLFMQFLQSHSFSLKKFFLMRRRLDGLLFFFAAFMFMLPTPTGIVLFGMFLGIGTYLLVFRPRKALRHLDTRYVVVTLIFSVCSLAINLANGSLVEDLRWSSYPLYYSFIIPVILGAVLVRDPLRQFVLGTRCALVIFAFWALAEVAGGTLRPGFGANPANAALALTFLAVISRLDVRPAPRLLSSRRVFFYLGMVAVLLTETRAALPVFAVGMIFDMFWLLKNRVSVTSLGKRKSIGTIAAVLVFALWSISAIYPIYAERVAFTFDEIGNVISNSDTTAAPGLSIRLAQWSAAVSLISEKPLLGGGAARISEEIVEHMPAGTTEDLSEFTFVHNFILDEAIQRGLIGVAILLSYFAFCFARIYKYGDASMRENILLILVFTISFGLLHYLLVKDRHVILYSLYFVMLTTANHGWRPPYKTKT